MIKLKKVGKITGEIRVPGDKSISHRAVMLGSIADGITNISGFLNGDDCLSTIECFKSLGVKTEINGTDVKVFGNGLYGLKKPETVLYAGNSGTTTRLLTGILSAQGFDSTITGDESIQKRPMKRVTEPLLSMGAQIDREYCPLNIKGRELSGVTYNMPVASAQVKSAILLAGLFANGETTVIEKEKSRDHTERMLTAFGADIKVDGLKIAVKGKNNLKATDVKIPGDISSAAFFIVSALIIEGSDITIKDIGVNPTRCGILEVLDKMGADIEISNIREWNNEPVADIRVRYSKLKGVEIAGDIIPRLIDELPVIAVLALFAEGKTVIKDASELKVKETNRILAVVTELKKCGTDITETDDGMIINGLKPLNAATFKSYNDHRMAMSLTVLAQKIDGECEIDDTSCVNISYPEFFEDFYRLGDK